MIDENIIYHEMDKMKSYNFNKNKYNSFSSIILLGILQTEHKRNPCIYYIVFFFLYIRELNTHPFQQMILFHVYDHKNHLVHQIQNNLLLIRRHQQLNRH
jgi:hypothetical protein